MTFAKFIATRLRELRKKHGLTQEQVAALLETDLKWYQRIEWGAKDLRASTVDRLAKTFGVKASEFVSETLPKTEVRKIPHKAPHRSNPARRRSQTSGKE